MVIREAAADALHKQLEISFPKSKGGNGLSSLRVRVIRAGHMVIIVSKSTEPGGVMSFTFEHQTISPLAGILNAAAETLAAGESNRLEFVHLVGPGMKLDNCFSSLRIDELGFVGIYRMVATHFSTT